MDVLMTAILILGCALTIVGGIWILFGTFRTSRALGWTFVLLPGPARMIPVVGWAALDWYRARTPIAIHLWGGVLILASQFAG